ncbi:MAG: hypothetical protein Q4C30_00710 [Bacteroidia bacterium]|nr:hypothetical protein [Bacteroidia bacterium]
MNLDNSIRISQGLAPIDENRRSWLYVICLDGAFLPPDTKVAGIGCSMLTSALGFRIVFSLKGAIPYLWREQCRIMQQCINRLSIPEDGLPHWDVLYRQVELLSAKNHYPGHSQVTLTVWLDEDRVHYLLQQCRIERNIFDVSTDPIYLLDYEEERLPKSPYNCIPRPTLLHHMATRAVSLGELKYHGAVLRDSDNRVVQSTLGNIYILIQNTLYTVSPNHGAVLDALAETIEYEASLQGLQVIYSEGLTDEMFAEASECFVASNEHGIHMILGLGNNRYNNKRLSRLAVYLKQRLIY